MNADRQRTKRRAAERRERRLSARAARAARQRAAAPPAEPRSFAPEAWGNPVCNCGKHLSAREIELNVADAYLAAALG